MQIFYPKCRAELRAWLMENYETESEVNIVFPTKASGEVGVSYNDAVEEALCFGWIDTTAGTLDATHGTRRFCKRKNEKYYSQPNIERLIYLNSEGLLLPKIYEKVKDVIAKPFVFPTDILERIKENPKAWENYIKFSPPYKRIRIAYIDAARNRPEEFEKRLASFISKTEKNKMIIGFGGVDKYYK